MCYPGERPYQCSVCGNSFTTKGNLKVHMTGHASTSIDKFRRPTNDCQPHASVTTPVLGPTTQQHLSSSVHSGPPGSGCCVQQVLPKSTTSIAVVATSPRHHCPTNDQQTAMSVVQPTSNRQSENVDSTDSPPSISVPHVLPDKALHGCPAVAAERLAPPPCQILTPVIPHSVPVYRAPTWFPPPAMRFPPPTTHFRSPSCFPAAGAPDGPTSFPSSSPRPPALPRAAVDPLEQFMEVSRKTNIVKKFPEIFLINCFD